MEQKQPFLLIVRGDKMMPSLVQRNTFLLHTDVLLFFFLHHIAVISPFLLTSFRVSTLSIFFDY